MLGGAAISGVMGGKNASKQASATRDAAAMADPFRSQRGMYQGILSNLYGGMAGSGTGVASSINGGFGAKGAGIFSRLLPQIRDRIKTGDATYASLGGGTAPGQSMMDFITSSPDYQFRLAEGQRALERSAAAKGARVSGGLLRDLTSFGQGQAASAYEAEINRIMTMAGATVGSPGVAGQLAAQSAAIRSQGQQQLMGGIGYGIGQLAQNWGGGGTTQAGMLQNQTGYTGGVQGILRGDEWASTNW